LAKPFDEWTYFHATIRPEKLGELARLAWETEMADNDDAARGREAALKVRKGKVTARRAKVAELYPAHSTTEIAEMLGWRQSTIANDVKALGISAPVGPRRKYPKPEPRECRTCGKTFPPHDASQVARGDGRYCSRLCARRSPEGREVGRRAATERHQRAEEELARLNGAGYLIIRQVAAERKVTESAVSQWITRGLLKAERRVIDGTPPSPRTRRAALQNL
jgi:hypothetical protein